jgi:hypothetical protein
LQCDFSSRVSEIDTAIATAVIKLIDAVLHSEIAAHFLYDTSRSGKGAVYIDARKLLADHRSGFTSLYFSGRNMIHYLYVVATLFGLIAA